VFEFKNNIVYYAGGVALTDSRGQITSHSNNIFYGGSKALPRSNGIDYNLSDLVSGYEPTASNGDPLFTNPAILPTGCTGTYGKDKAPNSDGLSLRKGSPEIKSGIAVI